jgi:hypothetical protein
MPQRAPDFKRKTSVASPRGFAPPAASGSEKTHFGSAWTGVFARSLLFSSRDAAL